MPDTIAIAYGFWKRRCMRLRHSEVLSPYVLPAKRYVITKGIGNKLNVISVNTVRQSSVTAYVPNA
jgi:hypothetical protein